MQAILARLEQQLRVANGSEPLFSVLREAVPEYNPHPDAQEAFEAAGLAQKGGSDT